MKFNPCTDNCTYEGTHCEGCGRTHQEIAETKKLVMAVVNFAQEQEYENIEDFANAIGQSVFKKLKKAAAGK
jgi:TolB-like protein